MLANVLPELLEYTVNLVKAIEAGNLVNFCWEFKKQIVYVIWCVLNGLDFSELEGCLQPDRSIPELVMR